MKLRNFLTATLVISVIACTNEAATENKVDTSSIDTSQSVYPEPDDVLGNDTIPAPHQSTTPTLENK